MTQTPFPLHRRLLGVLALAVSVAALPARAAPTVVEAPRDNVVSFSTTETLDVSRDLLSVSLTVVRDGNDARTVQTALKQTLDAALAEARKSAQPDLMEVRTGEFAIHPRYGREGKINGWQGSAALLLEGTDAARVAQTAGRLSSMNITGVSWGLSRKLREANESRLTADAVRRFRARATELAQAFGFGGYQIGEVSVNSGEPAFMAKPMMARMSAMEAGVASDAALPTEGGKGTLSVTVSGSIILRR